MKKSYFAIIPATVRYDERLSPNAKLLFGELTALANQTGACWASNQYFGDLYGKSKKSVSHWIKQLNEFGYIDVKIFYKEGSKEVEKRLINIAPDPTEKNLPTYGNKLPYPREENFPTPGEEKVTDNSTLINNTINSKKAEAFVSWFNKFMIEMKGKEGNFKCINSVKQKFFARMRDGYTEKDFERALMNISKSDFHRESNFQHITPTFLCRPDNLEKWCNASPDEIKEQPKRMTGK